MVTRSYHFVPANRPEMLRKTLPVRPGGLIYDLEDAVAPAQKASARATLADHFGSGFGDSPQVFVRVNKPGSVDYKADLELVKGLPGVGVVLPKLEAQEQLDALCASLAPEQPVVVLVESLRGLALLSRLQSDPRVVAAGLGMEDLLSELPRFYERDGPFVQHIKLQFTVAARAQGLSSVDSISVEFRDLMQLRLQCVATRMLGFDGMFSIHPSQIRTIEEVFANSAEEVAWAVRVVEKAVSVGYQGGYLKAGDDILSPPILKKAQQVLEQNHHK